MMYSWWRKKYNTSFQNLLLSALIGGIKDSEGNIFIDGKPICHDGWDLNDAKVACRQSGFINVVRVTTRKYTKF